MVPMALLTAALAFVAAAAPTAEQRLAAWIVLPIALGFTITFVYLFVKSRGQAWL